MPKIIWNEAPVDTSRNRATIFKSDDSEIYKGFRLSRDKEGLVVAPGIEGRFTKYMEAKAAIDHFLAKQTITDDFTIEALPTVQPRQTSI